MSEARASPALLSIQILRAIAALGVLTHHTFFETSHRFGGRVIWNNLVVGGAGVDLFFVISGFVMVYASESLFGRRDAPRVFFLRRLVRIVPLYWAVSVIILAYVLITYGGLLKDIYSTQSVIASFLFWPYMRPDGVISPVHGLGWTLNYEMLFYVVFAAAIVLPRRLAVLAVIVVLGALVAVGRLYALPLPFSFWCSPIVLEFCFGMLVALAWREGIRLPRAASWAFVAAAIAGFAAPAIWGPSGLGRAIEWGLPGAILVAGLTLSRESAQPGPLGRAFGFLGDASYSIYLVHPLVAPPLRWMLGRLIDLHAYPWAYAPAMFFGAIAAAIVSYLIFERPITRALQRRISYVRAPV